ncbi:MAG: hypothetical protein HY778_16605 [Betaproteobacteria bacterium]|nr:hypothetical protein [Betaproteobacteria bacterium]
MNARLPLLYRLFWVVLLGLGWTAPVWAADPPRVAVVLSDEGQPYQEVLSGLRLRGARMRGTEASFHVVAPAAVGSLAQGGYSAVVAVGLQVAQALVGQDQRLPVICTLLPQSAFAQLLASAGPGASRRISAVFIDQPVERQLDLVRVALPGRSHVGVLWGAATRRTFDQLGAAARDRKLRLSGEPVASEAELPAALMRLLGEVQVLLALPDTAVLNSQTVAPVLLGAYRHGVPVVGFSPAYVRAGALLAVYTTPEEVGGQTADMLGHLLDTGILQSPQFPRQFRVGVNAHVGRALGIDVAEEAVLTERVRRLEREP